MNKNWEQKQYEIMNWYHKNTTKIFRYVLGVLILFLFIFLVYIIIPTDTKNGVSNSYMLENGKEKALQEKTINNFTITAISQKYTKEQSIHYTANVLKFIDQHPSQELYKKIFVFLLEECKKPKNENTTILFNSLKKKVTSDNFIEKLNGDNTVLKTNLDICKETNVDFDDITYIEKLQKKHEYISNQIALIKEKRAFDKQAYGDVYNEDTGTFNFQEKNSSLEEEINNENKKMQSLIKELHNIEDKIKKIKPDIEVLQNKTVVDDKNNKNSVKQNELQETNQVSQVNQTTN
jgi:hypothetical protein